MFKKFSKTCAVLYGFIATIALPHLAFGDNKIPAAPNFKSVQGTRMPNNLTRGTVTQGSEKVKKMPKVRFGIRLTPFKVVNFKDRLGKNMQKFQKLRPIQHTLRARMNRSNHFYLGKYHLETIPVNWVKQANLYRLKMRVFKRFGAHGMLEEPIGTIVLEGKLKESEKDLFVLHGMTQKILMNKQQHPELEIVAGFSPPKVAKAKKPVPKSPIPLINKNVQTRKPMKVLSKDKTYSRLKPRKTSENPWKSQ